MSNLEFSIIFIYFNPKIYFVYFSIFNLKKKKRKTHQTKLVILGINKFNLIIKI
jgi:hypothetical protein